MIIKKCLTCGEEFKTWRCRIKVGRGKYCSNLCANRGTKMFGRNNPNYKDGGIKICHQCGEEYKNYDKDSKYCSRRCSHSFYSVMKKGNAIIRNGYIKILKHSHPHSNKQGYIYRSHLVAEKYLQRYLSLEEVVHHINRKKDDDRPENLYVFPTWNEHNLFEKRIKLEDKLKLKSNLI